MTIEKNFEVKNIAKAKESITKEKLIDVYNYIEQKSTDFFENKTKTRIQEDFEHSDRVEYDDLKDFKRNFADFQNGEAMSFYSSAQLGYYMYIKLKVNSPSYSRKEESISALISVRSKDRTEVEIDELIQETKDFIVTLFFSPEKETTTTNTSNTQPTDESNPSFWVKYKPMIEFVSLLLGVIVALITIFGAMKSCVNNTADNEVTENQSFYSQQNEISSNTDNVSLLS